MTLFFGYRDGCRCIAHPKDKKDIYELISKFLTEKGYKSYYTREYTISGVTTYDVGSWTEFFFSIDKDISLKEFWEADRTKMVYTVENLEEWV